ncbi:MAG: HzsA-related protein [Armatimonadota bacterium]
MRWRPSLARCKSAQKRLKGLGAKLDCAAVLAAGVCIALAWRTASGADDEWRRLVEADWAAQDQHRTALGMPVSTREDAVGGCDGVKDGRYGFHTGAEPNPWWQVDLGTVIPIHRIVIYNRCDAADRAARLTISLSDDGKQWLRAYQHDGSSFYGYTDGKPLVVTPGGTRARFVRISLPHTGYLHLDEVEVYTADGTNAARGHPADQSSTSQWSVRKPIPGRTPYPLDEVLQRGRRLAADLSAAGVDVRRYTQALSEVEREHKRENLDQPAQRRLYLKARWAVRGLVFSNPLINFDRVLFVKRVPGSYSHMSDQHYGWWSRPGGGVFILEGIHSGSPRVRCLTETMPVGSFLSPDLSYDGKKVLFAFCRYYPHVAGLPNKVDKSSIPEDAFYHIFEMNLDGSGLRQLTHGRYDDFDARYLPNGDIVFLSTRRGQFVQCGASTSAATAQATMPDSYVRCGGDAWRPVAVYTLHVMDKNRSSIRAISPFENFEWTPSVADDGRVLYARWDYVDRDNMPYMSLWATNPDGTHPQIVYGNFTRNPHCIFEARCVPGSRKIIFTASAHHSITGGSIVMLDPSKGTEGPEVITRLTPEVCFPESEGWPKSYYANPYPLSEKYYLVSWSNLPLNSEGGANPPNAMGIYIADVFGNLELLYRDPQISSMYPIPIRPRRKPPVLSTSVALQGPQEGRVLVLDVYAGLPGVPRGTIRRLRIVGVPAKTQPQRDAPSIGVTTDDPGKFVIGTAPVEADGSAHFRIPSGVPVFFQALNADGLAVQTMRSAVYIQPKQTLACVGCHEPRNTAPPNVKPAAASRPPSRITPGPEGSWPLRFDRLVQPVLDRHCTNCHRPGGAHGADKYDLTPARSYETLVSYGHPSLREHVLSAYAAGRSTPTAGAAMTSPLLRLVRSGHHNVRLDPDSLERLATWTDTYAQRQGHFSPQQEHALAQLRTQWQDILESRR